MYLNRKILIYEVDDDTSMREMLSDFLIGKFPDAEVQSFSSGEEVLVKISQQMPDLVILDYHLDSVDPSAMNGIQVLKKIKELKNDVPVIFLTSQDKSEIAANTMKFGAWDYVLKNEHAFNRLEIIINNILGHTALKENLGTQKFFNRLLAVLIIALLLGMIVSRFL